MKKKILVLVLMVVLLVIGAGVVSATVDPGNIINMQLDTTLTLRCQGGYMEAVVDNNTQPTMTQVTCYSFLPPIQDK